jgi:pyruvate carboxylase
VTTEDPSNDFMPDYGRVDHYRSGSGMGIRLDAGSAYSGAVVHPFYDSLLVKVTARGRRFVDAIQRLDRSLDEFRVRGVRTNIPYLVNLLGHPTFRSGKVTTRFIDQTPELFKLPQRRNRATRMLRYIGNTIVNGNDLVKDRPVATRSEPAPTPAIPAGPPPPGFRQIFQELGAEKFSEYLREQKPLLITDTSFRDAHQSLLATRVRTYDLLAISEAYAHLAPNMFSLEMWGGATFDTSMRFLKECPWQRLEKIRERVPNILLQMLLRASNAVGYTNYPDNIVREFVKEAASCGLDVFRVFDALNWVPNMQVAMEAVVESGAICEASICYTGDILDPSRSKYDLKYYVELAKELEKMGAHILAIKDMAGLCKPEAARMLVKALKEEVGLPIHFHTHDTAGIQAASILNAADVGLDIADAAMAPLSGGTAQPNLNTIAEALKFNDRDTGLDPDKLDQLAVYWRAAREFYTPFESSVQPATADLYKHQMPGGQYTNLYQQARALGLADQWSQVCHVYAQVNELFGDIVKVTPTSKAVGDMALFMVANDLTPEDVLDEERQHAFPASVVDLLSGMMGQPVGGFPEKVQRIILKGEDPLTDRPGKTLPAADFESATEKVSKMIKGQPKHRDVVSYLLYNKVFEDFAKHVVNYTDTSVLPTPVFFYGMTEGEEVAVEIERGKTLIIKFLTVGEPNAEGLRTVFFELNGHPRDVQIEDQSLESLVSKREKADAGNADHVGSSMPGMVVNVAVAPGDHVKKGQKLLVLEAMKMETTVYAERDGSISRVLVSPGSLIETSDLLIVYG